MLPSQVNRDLEKTIEISVDHMPKVHLPTDTFEDPVISSNLKLIGKEGKKLQLGEGVESTESGKSSTLREYKLQSKPPEDVVSRYARVIPAACLCASRLSFA
jgi:hypothetical protein